MYGCESWTIKKAEHRRIDAFELWCWRRLLRVPWTARRSNQSILKEISPEYSLEGLMLRLKLQYFGHLMQRTDSLEKTLMMGMIKERDDRGWDGWMASLTLWTWVWVSSGSWWWMGKPNVLQSMGLQRVGHDWVTELKWLRLEWLHFVIRIVKLYVFYGVSDNWLKDLSSFIQSLFKSYPFVLNSRSLVLVSSVECPRDLSIPLEIMNWPFASSHGGCKNGFLNKASGEML